MNNLAPPVHEQQLMQARSCGQQAMLFEQQGNFVVAAQGYDQAVGWTMQSMTGAMQAGVFVPPAIHYELGFVHFCAARAKAQLGWMPIAQQHLFQSLGSVNQAIAGDGRVAAFHVLAGAVLASQGNLREADRALTAALSLNPADGQAQMMLANVRATLGQMPPQQAQWAPAQQFPVYHSPMTMPAGPLPGMPRQVGGDAQTPNWTKTVGDWADLASKVFGAVGSYGSMMGKFD